MQTEKLIEYKPNIYTSKITLTLLVIAMCMTAFNLWWEITDYEAQFWLAEAEVLRKEYTCPDYEDGFLFCHPKKYSSWEEYHEAQRLLAIKYPNL